ncbi:MAG: NADH:ubiquinone reductase (Na(+)-transporting) subunit B [Gammaproteobacteria bacterium]|nr:MAG: NADH:ubiquinone reductase (Na(+)-transporting) subunit B [Gammaproteobacteria bacterium]
MAQGQGRLDPYIRALRVLWDRFLWTRHQPTVTAPHVRDRVNTQRLLNNFVIASIPCALIGCWNLGDQIHVTLELLGRPTLEGWRAETMIALGLGFEVGSELAALIHGLLYFLPILLTAGLAGALCEVVFAVGRNKRVDEGLLSNAWLFSLILPPSIPLTQVALGMIFAMIVAKGIYGGTGRYLVSPPVLGLSFLTFSYSNVLFGADSWVPVPGYDDLTTIEIAVLEGGVRALELVDYSWLQLFIGNQPGPIGVTSALACLLGAAWLIHSGSGSWRIMAGSAIGMVLSVSLLQAIGPGDDPMFDTPWYWHAVIGGWAFGTVFLATDPMAAATTRVGRWVFGVMVGVLTIVVRLTNPAYFEGVVFAILLASIFAPLCDYFVVERNIKRRQARLASTEAVGDAEAAEAPGAEEASA